jgi:hypothetical protein
MGILENFENAWDVDFQYESKPILETNNLGEPITYNLENHGIQNLPELSLDEEVIDN